MFSIVLVIMMARFTNGKLYSSQVDMDSLDQHETMLLETLKYYLHVQEQRVTFLQQKLGQLTGERPTGMHPEEYLGDPVAAFSLVRRMVHEWPLLLSLMTDPVDISPSLLVLPLEEDMRYAARGLLRLQEVYGLDTNELSKSMTALDCFELGQSSYDQQQFWVALAWYHNAFEKVSMGDSSVQREHVLAHIYLASTFHGCETGDIASSNDGLLHHLILEHSKFNLGGQMAQDYQKALRRNCSWIQNERINRAGIEYQMSPSQNKVFSELCQGIGLISQPGLRCYYVDYGNPRLLIAPFKTEEAHIDPPILIFHDVISDGEINEMKHEFHKNRQSCATLEPKGGVKYTNYRTCHLAWIFDSQTNTSARLSQRVGDVTNLAMGTSEEHQVATYGLGGEFQPHRDPLQQAFTMSPDEPAGDRIATLMFYLNDVPSGGLTVFPELQIAVTPRKGSAVFWFNLDHTGNILESMLHAGCPVLRGNKWVINEWIHEGGQDANLVCPSDEIFPKKYFYLD